MFRKWLGKKAPPPPYDERVSSKSLEANRTKFREMCASSNPLTKMWSLLWQTPGADQLPEAAHFDTQLRTHKSTLTRRVFFVVTATFTSSGREVTLCIDGNGALRINAHVTMTDAMLEAKWTGTDLATAVQVLIQHLRT